MSLTFIPKAYAGHHPPIGGTNTEVQVPAAAPLADSTSTSAPPSLLIAGILLAICIGSCFFFARKK